jgi:heterodisulfide reductase subunit B
MTGGGNGGKALYLGCIAPFRLPDIERATRYVFDTLDHSLGDVEGLSCCPTKASFTNVDETTALALSGRNIALAEEAGMDLVTVCNGCYSILAEAKHELDNDPVKSAEVQEVLDQIDRRYQGTSDVLHFVDYLHREVGMNTIASSVKHSLRGMRIAIFHGCHYLRPSEILRTDNPEDPKKIKEILAALGGRTIPYPGQLDCCGAGGGVRARDPETALTLLGERLDAIDQAEIDAIVTVCDFCFLHFDTGQVSLNERGRSYSIPVFHLSQMMALAMGAKPEEVAVMSKIPRHSVVKSIQEDGS